MIRWLWAFIDRPDAQFDEAVTFWTTVTGTRLSPRRGAHEEFATLLPEQGDACIKAQVVGGAGGVHIDLDVDDVPAAQARARELGASLIAEHDGYAVLRSPQGLVFCLTPGDAHDLPSPTAAPDGALSKLDQVCLDIGRTGYEAETRFWADLTGWELRPGTLPEFSHLHPDRPMPVRILLQRSSEDRPTTAHLDLACSDINALAAWHETLGAQRVDRGGHWIVMADPTGAPYCLTGRDPLAVTGG